MIVYAVYLFRRDYPALQRFTWSFLALNVAGFITYHLYPAAPPWYYHHYGCAVDLATHASEGPNLARVDAWLGIPYFAGMYGRSSDVFGAVPSLHVAYPLLLLIDGFRRHRWLGRVLLVWFYLSMCFAAVYLDHHWVFDIVLGSLYAVVISALDPSRVQRALGRRLAERSRSRSRASELGIRGDAAPSDRVRRYVAWAVRNGWWLWLVAVLLAIPASVRTVQLYANLKSDVEELLPRNAPSVAAIDELRARMPGVRYLGVLVDVGKPENLPAGERLVDDLAARVRKYPKDLVAFVRTGVQVESEFLKKNAPLYVDLADLKTVKERIAEQRDREVSKSLDLGLARRRRRDSSTSAICRRSTTAKGVDRFKDGRFSNAEQHLTLMLIEVASLTTGSDLGNALFKRVQADLKALGGPDKYAPGMRIGYTGDVAIDIEELAALVSDLSVSSVVVILLTLARDLGLLPLVEERVRVARAAHAGRACTPSRSSPCRPRTSTA